MAKLQSDSLFLLTDLYQLTMACGYWKCGKAEQEAAFHLTFRQNPFGGAFTVACGLAPAIDFFRDFRLSDSDRSYLQTLTGADGKPLFEAAFLDNLARLKLTCDIDAVPEGTVVFPQEPLVRVKGPLLEAQLLETVLLNIINFQTLIATKAARICMAARGNRVLEFGLRRAQGINGGLAASRAAYIGGCHATSNVLAGKLYGVPVAGTHAHSWVMSFDTEQESFEAYARAMPNNSIFLGGYLRHRPRHRERHPCRPLASRARPRNAGYPAGLRRPRAAQRGCPAHAGRSRFPRNKDRRFGRFGRRLYR